MNPTGPHQAARQNNLEATLVLASLNGLINRMLQIKNTKNELQKMLAYLKSRDSFEPSEEMGKKVIQFAMENGMILDDKTEVAAYITQIENVIFKLDQENQEINSRAEADHQLLRQMIPGAQLQIRTVPNRSDV